MSVTEPRQARFHVINGLIGAAVAAAIGSILIGTGIVGFPWITVLFLAVCVFVVGIFRPSRRRSQSHSRH
jgi:membrane protein implicated in regulation of membrane protease activity